MIHRLNFPKTLCGIWYEEGIDATIDEKSVTCRACLNAAKNGYKTTSGDWLSGIVTALYLPPIIIGETWYIFKYAFAMLYRVFIRKLGRRYNKIGHRWMGVYITK